VSDEQQSFALPEADWAVGGTADKAVRQGCLRYNRGFTEYYLMT
jgi:hypothetical protein